MTRYFSRETLAAAFCIALFPPIWAVLAPHLGIETGAVALICAGLYAAGGDDIKKAIPMSLGFLAGDIWAVLAITLTEVIPLPASVTLYIVLIVMGGLAVLISARLPRLFFTPAWLAGWAIGLTVMASGGTAGMGTLPLQIRAAAIAGIWYVGVAVGMIQRKLTPSA